MMKRNRLLPILVAAVLLLAAIPFGVAAASGNAAADAPRSGSAAPVANETQTTTAAPKYVFLFIGDGMTYP